MQQRRLRLGDILDDYCSRERRVTNHVVVAIVEDDVKQTRCSTCQVDHEYKQGKAPVLRRTKVSGALAAEIPEDAKPHLTPPRHEDLPLPGVVADVVVDTAARAEEASNLSEPPVVVARTSPVEKSSVVVAVHAEVVVVAKVPAAEEAPAPDDDGPIHRRLIRATFPRPEGHVPERREPEFTVRQQGGRGRGGEVDGNRTGFRGRGPQQGQPGQGGQGGQRNFGGRQQFGGGGQGPDGPRGGRGPEGSRGGGGGFNRGPRPGGGGSGRRGGGGGR